MSFLPPIHPSHHCKSDFSNIIGKYNHSTLLYPCSCHPSISSTSFFQAFKSFSGSPTPQDEDQNALNLVALQTPSMQLLFFLKLYFLIISCSLPLLWVLIFINWNLWELFFLQIRYQKRVWIRAEQNYGRNGKMFTHWFEGFRAGKRSCDCVQKRQALSVYSALHPRKKEWQSWRRIIDFFRPQRSFGALNERVMWVEDSGTGAGCTQESSILTDTTVAGSRGHGEGSRWVWYGSNQGF